MAVTVLRLGSPRARGEGVRLGTVRRPPRGVPKSEFTKRDFYDVWLPTLSPSQPLVSLALKAQKTQNDREWKSFVRKFRAEMRKPESAHTLDTLAALSRQTNFSLGCYCENEARCHRSILKILLAERGAEIA